VGEAASLLTQLGLSDTAKRLLEHDRIDWITTWFPSKPLDYWTFTHSIDKLGKFAQSVLTSIDSPDRGSSTNGIHDSVEDSDEKEFNKNAKKKCNDVPLDIRALAVFVNHQNWSKKQIAEYVGCNDRSLAPKRCPKLAQAIAASRAKIDNNGRMIRGSKDDRRNLEAWEEDPEE
jgi:hypothetical protein